MVEFNPPLCRLADLVSRNGTVVNGKRVEKADLAHGDLIEAGETVFRVRFDERPEPEQVEIPPASAPLTAAQPRATELAQTVDYRPPYEATIDAISVTAREDAAELPCIEGYEIVRELGRGGMGVVYLAKRLSDATQVAVKTIRPAVSGSQQEIERFLREARILSKLRHPGIVRFEETGQAGEVLYFVMEYVRGTDASRELKKYKRISIGPVVRIACDVLEALQYAHEQGYIHRDVKPSNLLLAKEGRITKCKLADFGLARAYNSSPLSGLTMMGDVAGTLPYMPPEQITDYRHALPPADQYATAATLYHMLTGQYIFDFDDLPGRQRIAKILCDPPISIRARRGDIPDELA